MGVNEKETSDNTNVLDDGHQHLYSKFGKIYKEAPVGLCFLDVDLRYVYINDWLANINGLPAENHIGRVINDVLPHVADGVLAQFQHVISTGEPIIQGRVQAETPAHPGIKKHYIHNFYPVKDENGSVVGISCAVQDVTELTETTEALEALHRDLELHIEERTRELKMSEEQLRQSQKMEAIGTLAGGIAHDFNNILTCIGGYGQVLLEELQDDDPLHHGLSEIVNASDRATDLTRKLLVFSRKQALEPEAVDIGEIVNGMENFLARLIGEHIELEVQCSLVLQAVNVGPGQIDQVIMNLVVNARDAMPTGGKISINIDNVVIDEYASARLDALPTGNYVELSISDNGDGITEEVLPRIFEPFFTTKGADANTGLGLSTVFGIVKQSGGTIDVKSEPGGGSTFFVYLPQIEMSEPVTEKGMPPVVNVEGCETILVVEDEEMIRELIKIVLAKSGYTVLVASHGDEALQIAEQHKESIDLMITDIVMPGVNGYELAERITQLAPEVSIIFMSGYDDAMVTDHRLEDRQLQFIQKPFRINEVIGKVREILDATKFN